MKLTPLDMQQQQFPNGAFGYQKKEVRTFLEFVSREFETLLAQQKEQQTELRRLEDELFKYREREDMLKEALVTAQRIAEDTRAQAKKESDLVIAEAEMKAERIIHHAHTRLLAILEEITDMKRQRIQLEEGLRQIISTHQKLLDAGREQPSPREGANDEQVTYLDRARSRGVTLEPATTDFLKGAELSKAKAT